MPSDPTITALYDISRNISLASNFTQGMVFQAFETDPKCIYAVTRCLEIISEASRRLPDALKTRHPSIAWRNIAGAGNVYRHDYEDVTPIRVWEAVHRALPALLEVVEAELRSLRSGG